jgi:methylene-fatty-acyl-phospholipid synthase
MDFTKLIDLTQPTLYATLAFVVFNPALWNTVGRLEHHYKLIRQLFCGHKIAALYFFATIIFSCGIARDWVFHDALTHQPKIDLAQFGLSNEIAKIVALPFFALGALLVFSAYYRLGIDGTYLGDYFGILKKERITGFPFSVTDDPMYLGSSLSFFALGLWGRSPAGMLIAVYVFTVYKIYSVTLEGPFTTYIYSEAAKRAAAKDQKKAKKAQ